MTKRRSLTDALTPAQEAFLSAGRGAASNVTEDDAAKSGAGVTQTTPEPVVSKPEIPPSETQKTPNGWLVPLTTRISEPVMQALIRASMERKLQRVEPYSQQDIVAVAVTAWLKTHGYYPFPKTN